MSVDSRDPQLWFPENLRIWTLWLIKFAWRQKPPCLCTHSPTRFTMPVARQWPVQLEEMGSWIGSVVNSQQDDTPNGKHETHPCKIMQTSANQKASQICNILWTKRLWHFLDFGRLMLIALIDPLLPLAASASWSCVLWLPWHCVLCAAHRVTAFFQRLTSLDIIKVIKSMN